MSPASSSQTKELSLTQRGTFIIEFGSWVLSTGFHWVVALFVGLANTFLPFLPVSAPLQNGYSQEDFESYEDRLQHAEDQILATCPKTVERLRVTVPCGSGQRDLEIHTLHVVPDAGSNQHRHPLVFLHGYGSAGVMWTQHFADFSEHYDVYTVDMVGWGRSTRPDFNHLTEGLDLQHEWVDHLEAWRKKLRLDKVTVVGHSLGSIIGTRWAVRYPNSIEHLVNVNMGGIGETSGKHTYNFGVMFSYTPQRATRELGRVGQHMFDKGCRLDPTHPHQSRLRAFLHTLWQHPEPSGEIAFRKMYDFRKFFTQIRWNCPLLPHLETLKMPVTLVHGRNDFMIPLEHAQMASTYIKDAQFRIIDNAEHAPHIEQADEWRRVVLEELLHAREGKRGKQHHRRRNQVPHHIAKRAKSLKTDLRPNDHTGSIQLPLPLPVIAGVMFGSAMYFSFLMWG
eukprot:TRINITY_DN3192_c0_g1_i3.p1 TRINITY_DN3192_c0_g1~~TRINITY_DN3192_c0_g1_i3.p1  ORF type:complete len:452 (-),score=80.43 TRINITY_DN3192_c0_g1_i3:1595-2950(-)